MPDETPALAFHDQITHRGSKSKSLNAYIYNDKRVRHINVLWLILYINVFK